MKVRVVDEILSPGVQDGEEADLGAEVFWVCGDRPQRLRGGGKEQVIHHGLVLVRNGRDFLRQGKDDMKILSVQQLLLTMLDPLRPGERLALRTMAIPARNGARSITESNGSSITRSSVPGRREPVFLKCTASANGVEPISWQ
jgi:hypothetical protein